MTKFKQTSLFIYILIFSFAMSFQAFAITIKQEEDIAKEFIDTVKNHYKIITDPEVADYITNLGNKILKKYPEQPFNYHFYVIKDGVFNAFAGPGGHIFINSGLFAALQNEDELAGIIGHEISHVSCRHISDRIERSGKIGLSTIAGVAAGIFLGIYGDPTAGTALTIGALAGGQSLSLAYSRDDEMQADRIGLKYLNEAGFSGVGLKNALVKIRSRQWFGKDQIPVYLTTHPALEDRMNYISGWIDNKEKNKFPQKENSFDFLLAHTKITSGYLNIDKSRAIFKKRIQASKDDILANYGYGIVLSRSGKFDSAIKHLKISLEKKAFHTGMLKTLGQVYFDSGDYKKAINVFKGILTINPGDFECNLYYSRCLAEMGELNAAEDAIKTFTAEKNGKIKAFYYLADIYSRKNSVSDSSYYLGLYYLARKDFINARLQLDRALSNTNDSVKIQKIKEMIKKLKAEKKKQK